MRSETYKPPSMKIPAKAIFWDKVRCNRNMTGEFLRVSISLLAFNSTKLHLALHGKGNESIAASVMILGTALPMKNA